MTQAASAEAFVGKFDGTTIDSQGLPYRVFKKGDEFWALMPDPDEMVDRQRIYDIKKQRGLPVDPPDWKNLPQVERQVVMSTGSHRYQTYWVESERYPGTLMTLPLVYLIRDQRWIPREAAFMSPPGAPRLVTVWNDHCIKCHSTGPVPRPYAKTDPATRRISETGFHSEVGELGIACEACHGPAKEHVRQQEMLAAGRTLSPDEEQPARPDVVQPELLSDHRRQAEICGQCHGNFVRSQEQGLRYRDEGDDYVPGDELLTKRHYIFPPHNRSIFADEDAYQRAVAEFQQNPGFFRERFWDNGLVLAGGREFSALAVSQCYIKGTLSCLFCHSMHQSDPNKQLKPEMDSSAACTSCHDQSQYNSDVTRHTHHAAESSGSNCLNCHMPHTTYALFSAIRNHQIESPDLAGSVQHGTPNACNLCHLDRTLAWTQERLVEWYGYEPQTLSYEQQNIAAALNWLLNGHAAQRVIVAWHMGWKPAQEASGDDWLAPFVAKLLADPYGVVRYVAEHSLATLPGYADFKYNFLASPEALSKAADDAARRWESVRGAPPGRTGREVLIGADGKVIDAAVDWLQQRRDNRPVSIAE
jgi:predicted CXXCH cytochrome family protein